MIASLVHIAVGIKKETLSRARNSEKKDLMEKYNQIGGILRKCMSSNSMDNETNVVSVLRSHLYSTTDSIHVSRAKSFVSGPLFDCLVNDVHDIIGTAQVSQLFPCVIAKNNILVYQVSNYIDKTFWCRLKKYRKDYWLKSNCTNLRYSPAFLFYLAGFLKLIFISIMAHVCINVYNDETFGPSISSPFEIYLIITAISVSLYEWYQESQIQVILEHNIFKLYLPLVFIRVFGMVLRDWKWWLW